MMVPTTNDHAHTHHPTEMLGFQRKLVPRPRPVGDGGGGGGAEGASAPPPPDFSQLIFFFIVKFSFFAPERSIIKTATMNGAMLKHKL